MLEKGIAYKKTQIVNWMKIERWTPELISAKSQKLGIDMVSHETIYRWIWEMKKSNCREDKPYKYIYTYLKHGKRRRKRGKMRDSRGVIPGRVSIENRPALANKRKRLGDYEVDLMMGKGHQSALLVITDRKTIKTRIRKVKGKGSEAIADKIIQMIQANKMPAKTFTFDNDLAFAAHEWVAKQLKAKTYFAHPYTSQEKGTVENRIGVLRMFFPKKTDFNLIHSSRIKSVENSINIRPVRKFGYRTPNEEYDIKLKCCTY